MRRGAGCPHRRSPRRTRPERAARGVGTRVLARHRPVRRRRRRLGRDIRCRHGQASSCVEFEERASLVCPSGRLCIGFDGDEWLLFDLISGKLRARLPRITMVGTGPDGEKWAVTPDGRHICFISTTGRFRIIDVKSWDVVLDQTTESPGNAGPFVDVAVSPDGSVIYVIGSVKEVRRWDMKGRNWLAPLPVVEPGTLLPHPDGRHLLVASSVLRRYELRSMRELPGPDGYSGSVSVVPSPDGRGSPFLPLGADGTLGLTCSTSVAVVCGRSP